MVRVIGLLLVLLLLVGCRPPVESPPPPTPAPPTPTTIPTVIPTPTAIPPPKVDPIAAIFERQGALQTFRQSLLIDLQGVSPAGQPIAMKVWAEGESARPDSRLQVGTDALGGPVGFQVLQVGGRLYLNFFGAWVALEAEALPPGVPLVPIPTGADPRELVSALMGAQVIPATGESVRGTATDSLRFTLPSDRAEALARLLLVGPTVALLQGSPTYTEAGGELAVGRDDGFVRRITLYLRGYSGGDPTRAFSLQSQTELWDVNDPAIAVTPPTEPALHVPRLPPIQIAPPGGR
jgi:hypothetical protein